MHFIQHTSIQIDIARAPRPLSLLFFFLPARWWKENEKQRSINQSKHWVVWCVQGVACVRPFLALGSCVVSDGHKWQKWLVVIGVVELINHAPRLLDGAVWHVQCGMMGTRVTKEHVFLGVRRAKTASWASADDEWLHSVDAVRASCFYSPVCWSFMTLFTLFHEKSPWRTYLICSDCSWAMKHSPNQVKGVTWWPSPGWFLNSKHIWATHIQLVDSHLLKVDRSQRSSSAVLQIEKKNPDHASPARV